MNGLLATKPRPTVVYRLFAEDGSLLYVGMSSCGISRVAQHSLRPWWCDVRSVTIEHHPDEIAGRRAEEAAIRQECPQYNILRFVSPGPLRVELQALPLPASAKINRYALRTIRIGREVSTTDLAQMVGISHSHLSNIEAGRRAAPAPLIRALAAALKINVIAIVGPEKDPTADELRQPA